MRAQTVLPRWRGFNLVEMCTMHGDGVYQEGDFRITADLSVAQSCRAYLPMGVSHYKAPWWTGSRGLPPPTWPGGLQEGVPWDRARLEEHYEKWAALARRGVGVHCGEGGCFIHTPHDVFLRWFREVLEILTAHGIGFALWNLRGAFGILDSGRPDVAYEDWHGHKFDRKLLDLLQEFA